MVAAVRQLADSRSELPFAVDGVVVKAADFLLRKKAGAGAKSPNWAIAYKFTNTNDVTRLLSVCWQVGRTGRITPVAEFTPVMLGGTTVSRATLHSYRVIADRDIRQGDWIEVERAGGVIPSIARPLPARRNGEEKRISAPEQCPCCDTALEVRSAELCCPNSRCADRVCASLAYFAERSRMNISGLGPATCRLLVDHGFVQDPADLYEMDEADWERVARLPGLGTKSVEKVRESLALSRQRSPDRVLAALGVPGVGPSSAKRLIEKFGSLEAIAASDTKELVRVRGIGSSTAESLIRYFRSENGTQVVQRLICNGVGRSRSPNGRNETAH